MATVQEVLADPEFQQLTPADKRTFLSEIDPEFGSLNDSDIQSFSTPGAPLAAPAIATVDPERQAVIQSFQQPTLDRLLSIGSIGPQAIAGLTSMVGGAGGEQVATLEKAINTARQGNISAAANQLVGDIAQTGIEGGTRVGFDVLNMGRQAINAIPSLVSSGVRQAINQPSSLLSPASFATGLATSALTPRTPTEPEIQASLERRLQDAAFAQQREAGVAPITLGEAQPNAADLLGIVADPQLGAALATGAVARTAPRLLSGLPGGSANLTANALEAGGRAATGFRATARDFLTKFKNPTTDTEIASIVRAADEGALLRPVQEVLEVAGAPKDAKDFAPKVRIAKEARGSQLDEFLSGDTGDSPMNASAVLQAQIDDINAHPKLNDPEIPVEDQLRRKQELIARAQTAFGKEWTARDLFNEQKRLNTLQKADIEKSKVSRENLLAGNAMKSMDDAARRAISQILDDYQKGVTGIDDNAFRAYGQLSELETDVSTAYNRAVTARSQRAAGRGPSIRPQAGLGGKVGMASEVSRPLVGRIAADELKDLDEATIKLFQRLPSAQAPITLDEASRQALLARSRQQPPLLASELPEGATPQEINAYLNEQAQLRMIEEAQPQLLDALLRDLAIIPQ